MRLSTAFFATLRENPRDAEVVSHQLMSRANLLKKHGAGIYSYMPFFMRSLLKLQNIIREEFERIGWQEVQMPILVPAELWKESGRWDKMGPLMFKLKDRKEGDYCLGPTHEEVVCDIVRSQVTSYKQLPFTLYQMTNKYRDEIRPRFGIMRGREFLMMDGYSFDKDQEGLDVNYDKISEAYCRIFERAQLNFVRVAADSGAIGGDSSHEFHVLAQSGEDLILSTEDKTYAANVEKAECAPPEMTAKLLGTDWGQETSKAFEEVATPNAESIDDVSKLLQVPAHRTIKTLVYQFVDAKKPKETQPVVAYIAGHRSLNEVKLGAVLQKAGFSLLSLQPMPPEQVKDLFQCAVGSIGPIGGPEALRKVRTYFDREIIATHDAVCGANKEGYHLVHVEVSRDVLPLYVEGARKGVDLSTAVEGEPCPQHPENKPYTAHRGIEVGHIFKLGDVYSKAMKTVFTEENGKSKAILMGCYGIGVTRTLASAVEQNNDADGICWPKAIAPYQIQLVTLAKKDEADVIAYADSIYESLKAAGVEVLYDDRDLSPGAKFKDADLLGIPYRLVVGQRGISAGELEFVVRRNREKSALKISGVASGDIQALLKDLQRALEQ